jgi:hypothetical protein
VVTLEADNLSSGEAAPVRAGGDRAPATEVPDAATTGPVAPADPAGNEDGEESQPLEIPDAIGAHLSFDAALRQVDLYERAVVAGLGDVSRRTLEGVLAVPAEVLADCWRAVGEGLAPLEDALGLRPELLGAAASPALSADTPSGYGPGQPADDVGAVAVGQAPPAPVSTAGAGLRPAAMPTAQAPVIEGATIRSVEIPVTAAATVRTAKVPAPPGAPEWGEWVLAALAAGGLVLLAERTRRRPGYSAGGE